MAGTSPIGIRIRLVSEVADTIAVIVMADLVPAIHVCSLRRPQKDVDGWAKPSHDDEGTACVREAVLLSPHLILMPMGSSPAMTGRARVGGVAVPK